MPQNAICRDLILGWGCRIV
jgi:hypothetical protein